MKKRVKGQSNNFKIGLGLIILAALCNAVGQLMLKLGTDADGIWSLILYGLGFVIAALGAIFMMTAFRFGEVSILQPIMSIAYVFSFIFGLIFLGETSTITKIMGTVLIIAGSIVMSLPNKNSSSRRKAKR